MIITELLINTSVYVLIGVFAGLMAGILGIGGGVVVVPGLAFVFQYNHMIPAGALMQVAAGTSLAAMIVTSQASLRAHLKLSTILWPIFYRLWPGIIVGVITGALTASFLPTLILKFIFAVFLLMVAVKMLMDLHVTHSVRTPGHWVDRLISFLIGLKAGLLGVGGGILIIPYLTYCGVDVRKIAAVCNLCTLTVALVGTIVFMIIGHHDMAFVPYSTGYVYWPAVLCIAIPSLIAAPFGVKLNYILPVKQLKYAFIVILLVTAIEMLF